MNLDELKANVRAAQDALDVATEALEKFESLAENNVFESLAKAKQRMEVKLYNRAEADCEGAGNCGDEEYEQEFIVGDQKYLATATVQYNRHDKTYYYIDEFELTVEEVNE